MLSLPPYLPSVTHACGMTYGTSGSRSSTGGRLLSMLGACWYLPGTASGSLDEPTAWEPPPAPAAAVVVTLTAGTGGKCDGTRQYGRAVEKLATRDTA